MGFPRRVLLGLEIRDKMQKYEVKMIFPQALKMCASLLTPPTIGVVSIRSGIIASDTQMQIHE